METLIFARIVPDGSFRFLVNTLPMTSSFVLITALTRFFYPQNREDNINRDPGDPEEFGWQFPWSNRSLSLVTAGGLNRSLHYFPFLCNSCYQGGKFLPTTINKRLYV
jgi:hypothetical protein